MLLWMMRIAGPMNSLHSITPSPFASTVRKISRPTDRSRLSWLPSSIMQRTNSLWSNTPLPSASCATKICSNVISSCSRDIPAESAISSAIDSVTISSSIISSSNSCIRMTTLTNMSKATGKNSSIDSCPLPSVSKLNNTQFNSASLSCAPNCIESTSRNSFKPIWPLPSVSTASNTCLIVSSSST